MRRAYSFSDYFLYSFRVPISPTAVLYPQGHFLSVFEKKISFVTTFPYAIVANMIDYDAG